MEATIDRGKQGNKRASWDKVHYRDLALRLCEENPGESIENLAELFLDQLKRYPAYMHSIAIYVMANTRASLVPRTGSSGSDLGVEKRVIRKVASKVMNKLMSLQLPSGKTLAESTGEECIRLGGWFGNIGRCIGAKDIVGEKLSEGDLEKLWKKSK